MKPVTVVVIDSLSYTGTTWINCLLGCHERAFALGPPHRVIDIYDNGKAWKDACRVHGAECDFWPKFHETYNPKANLYLQLASFCGKDHIIINNAFPGHKAAKDLRHRDVLVKRMRVVRDGRAVCRSYLRHHPDKDFVDAVKDWLLPAAQHADEYYLGFDEQDPDVLSLRYEDVVSDQFAMIKKMGDFVGLDYPENFYKFWVFEHHLAAGSASIPGMIRRFQLNKQPALKKDELYDKEFERLKVEPEKPVFDEGWKREFSRRQLFLFDFYCGAFNEHWGYERDTFTTTEFEEFQTEIQDGAARLSRLQPPKPLGHRSKLAAIIRRIRRRPAMGSWEPAWIVAGAIGSHALVGSLAGLIAWLLLR